MALLSPQTIEVHKRKTLSKKFSIDEEEISEFVKNSASLVKLREIKEKMLKELEEQEKQKVHINEGSMAPLSLAGEYKGGKDKELAKWRQRVNSADRRNSDDIFTKHKDKLKDIMRTSAGREARKELDAIEKERRELEMENQRLRDVINLRHACSLRREEKCQREIADLKQRLDGVALSGYDERSLMSRLRNVNCDIQEEILQLKGIIESQAEVEKMNLIRAYRVKMHELKKQLTDEKELNYTGAQEWIEKNKVLQHDLDAATLELNQLKDKNKQLIADNRNLKAEYQTQEQERNATLKSITLLKKENQRLEDQIEKLEYQIVEVAKKRAGDSGVQLLQAAADAVAQSGNMTAEKRKKYLQAINKMKAVLEQDRKALKHARSEHMTLLAERTELELFLRQCVDDVRKEIARHSKMLWTRPVSQMNTREVDISLDQYTSNDRKKILDILLSKERVLMLLYERTFPYKKDPLERERETEFLDPALAQMTADGASILDTDQLWTKWKSWTDLNASITSH